MLQQLTMISNPVNGLYMLFLININYLYVRRVIKASPMIKLLKAS